MEILFILIITNTVFFIGFMIGKGKGINEGRRLGYIDGINTTLDELKKLMTGGLKSTLDWETTQRLLNEKMSKN